MSATDPQEYSTPGFAPVDPEAPWLPYVDDDTKSRIPEPALIRGAVVAVLSLVGVIVGHKIELPYLDEALNAYTVILPLALSLWIRKHVSPAKSGDATE